ncbi:MULTISPECIES: hypothetical protein [unclassified Nocardioides]|uniref:hypothetical protein n=1 Tax=unclassified Nocardioides TaxID=2615069 RepID=UPI0006F7B0BF|nr:MULTISPECIES: hypothetical protein [unclassified Nocardioides]KQY61782.1 hypothetical protein ASD30_25360 [Nocardioides sp. Root140]KQZ70770.1 hypothetical protein ASD66_14465 [Nocardioides sp. Root151]KRF10883.1 hypothetical protein ASH02_18740 [Nocardioides sp. Soil796]
MTTLPEHSRLDELTTALASGRRSQGVIAEIAREYAVQGEPFAVFLEDLDLACTQANRRRAGVAVLRAAALAWSDSVLERTHASRCEDPATGLATLQHAQTQLSALYQASARTAATGVPVKQSHELVVVELRRPAPATACVAGLQLAAVGESLRMVFDGDEVIAGIGPHRAVVIAERTARLARACVQVAELLAAPRQRLRVGLCRVWLEPLPARHEAAQSLLGCLAASSTE